MSFATCQSDVISIFKNSLFPLTILSEVVKINLVLVSDVLAEPHGALL